MTSPHYLMVYSVHVTRRFNNSIQQELLTELWNSPSILEGAMDSSLSLLLMKYAHIACEGMKTLKTTFLD